MVRKKIIKELHVFRQALHKDMPVSTMILFGSRAWGKPHKDSDIDLLIISSKFKQKKSFQRALGFRKYWHLDYPVDFLCYTPQEFKDLSSKVTLVKLAKEKGIEIKA